MASTRRARKSPSGPSPTDAAALQKELNRARRELVDAEERKVRAVARETARLRKENEMLEAQLTRMVQEIGELRFVVDRVHALEQEVRRRDARLAEADAELERLRAALDSGRPTAIAAAAASRAARLFSAGRPG